MKSILASIILLAINNAALSQWSDNGNHIRNNSLEVVNFTVWENLCQTVLTNEDPGIGNGILNTTHCTSTLTDHELLVEYWDQISHWTIPDQENSGILNSYVGSPDLLTNMYTDDFNFGTSRTGVAWLGVVSEEHATAELEVPLIPGAQYYLEFFFNTSEAGNLTTISIFDDKPQHKIGLSNNTLEENNNGH